MEEKKKDNSRINKTEGKKINVNTKILKDIFKKSGEMFKSKLIIYFKRKIPFPKISHRRFDL